MSTDSAVRAPHAPLFHPELSDVAMDDVLRALGDSCRLQIVRTLAEADHPLPGTAFDLTKTKSTCTHHFRVLREAGLIAQHDEGTARMSELRRADLDARFPGLLEAVLRG